VNRDRIDIPQDLRRTLDHQGNRFLEEFLEIAVERHPDNVDALAELGQVCTRLGHWERGLAVDRELVRLVPSNPTVHYNLGCSQALLGLTDAALDSLSQAAELGYDDWAFLESDEDLVSLRGDERFRALIEQIRARTGIR
jgi:Flp pilus assembly protein TadD